MTHLVPIGIFAVGLVAVVVLGRRHRAAPGPGGFSRTWALLIPVATIPFQVIDLVHNFDIAVTLPLHLCDLAWIAAVFALWTHHPYPVALTYLWGLVLTVQGIVTPAVNEDFAHPRYFAFWALHLLIVWAAVYLVWGKGLVVRWRDYGAVIATTLVWMAATYGFNLLAETNYGYLMRKPRSSILDFFADWPWYLAQEIALVAIVWAGLTLLAQVVRRPSRGSRRPRGRSRPT